jgi:excisionase family DNA binding protein
MNTLESTERSRLLTKAQIAEELNVTVRTVSNWMSRGVLPHIKVSGRILFPWPEVRETLKRNFGRNFQ